MCMNLTSDKTMFRMTKVQSIHDTDDMLFILVCLVSAEQLQKFKLLAKDSF